MRNGLITKKRPDVPGNREGCRETHEATAGPLPTHETVSAPTGCARRNPEPGRALPVRESGTLSWSAPASSGKPRRSRNPGLVGTGPKPARTNTEKGTPARDPPLHHWILPPLRPWNRRGPRFVSPGPTRYPPHHPGAYLSRKQSSMLALLWAAATTLMPQVSGQSAETARPENGRRKPHASNENERILAPDPTRPFERSGGR